MDQPEPAAPWNLLSRELLELILVHLPASHLYRLRFVCRTWLSCLSSPHFRLLYRQMNPRLRCCLFIYNHSVTISFWSTSESRWRDLGLPTFYIREWAGSRGIVCLRSHLLKRGYIIGNPLTGAWTEVPDPIDISVAKIWALVVDESCSTYWIILLQRTSATLQIYSSELDRWTRKPILESVAAGIRTPMDRAFSGSATCIGSLVYGVDENIRDVIVYDVKQDSWKHLGSGLPQGLIFRVEQQGYLIDTPPKLVNGPRGKTLLVGGLVEHGMECIAGVVWELDSSRKAWNELSRAPFQMWKSILEDAKKCRKSVLMPVRYVGDGELIVVLASGCQRAITFNLREDRWTWLDLPSTAN